MTIINPPTWLQVPERLNGSSGLYEEVGYSAADDRRVISSIIGTAGVTSYAGFRVTPTPTASMVINVAAGSAFINGTQQANQGTYHVVNDGTVPLTVATASGSFSRRDLVVLYVEDEEYSGSLNRAVLDIISGTPASSPQDPSIPANAIVLARITVPQNAQSISGSNINHSVRNVARLRDYISTTPAGVISQYAGATAPEGYLICDGSAVSRTTYPELFEAIGTQYGAGNGSTTFNIPNLRGRVAVGVDTTVSDFNVRGKSGGSRTHTLTVAQMPAHNHGGSTTASSVDATMNISGSTSNPAGNSGVYRAPTSGGQAATRTIFGSGHTHTIASQGNGQEFSLLSPYLAVNHIIKT